MPMHSSLGVKERLHLKKKKKFYIPDLCYRTIVFNTILYHVYIKVASLLFLKDIVFCILMYSYMLNIKMPRFLFPFSLTMPEISASESSSNTLDHQPFSTFQSEIKTKWISMIEFMCF